MQRVHGTARPSPFEGETVYDIFHVWPDNYVENGVKFRSWVMVYLRDEPADDEPVRVTLHLPGGRQDRDLAWGQEWYAPVPGWGLASAHAEGDYPLEFFWELTPGKA